MPTKDRGGYSFTLAVQLDFTGAVPQLTGTVSDGNWTATIVADPPATVTDSPSPFMGNYDLAMSAPGSGGGGGSDDGGDHESDDDAKLLSAEVRGGLNGSAAVAIDAKASLRMKGKLNNGAKLKQRVSLSPHGDWPMWTSLGKGKGAMMGWLKFSGSTASDPSGEVLWLQPNGAVTPVTISPQP